MYKMLITLIVEVIVLMQLLHTGSSTPECAEDCLKEGKTVTYECQVPALRGTLIWKGVGFDCSNPTHPNNKNTISLPATSCPLQIANEDGIGTGRCGPYFGNLSCTINQNLTSMLIFEANYEMNGGSISCEFLRTNKNKTFPVRVGVAPNPPSNVRVETRKDGSFHFEWTPPDESIGGIRGYSIHYGDCGNCTPEAGFVNRTEELTADCSEFEENTANNSMICSLNVSTVSEDCRFESRPVEAARCSVEEIRVDTSSAVTPDQCIEVLIIINNHCGEKSDTFEFRAQVQFIEGYCGSDHELTNTTSNYTLEDYKTCVPVIAGTICYSTVIFHNELELGRTERQELILLPCILKTSNSTRVNINSTIGEIPRGIEMIPHNTTLYFFCYFNCTIDQSQSRCANGTFQPSISHILQDECRCFDGTDSKLIIGSTIGSSAVVLLLLVVVVIILGGCLCCRWRKNSAGKDLQLVEPDPDDRDRGMSNASYLNIELQQTITQNSVSIN